MRRFALAAAALALLAPGRASAQPVSSPAGPAVDTYLELHLGAFVPQHDDLDAFDVGYDFGATVGARFTPNLGVEAELGYLRASADERRSDVLLGDVRVEQALAVVPLTASLRFRLPLKVAELSAVAGGGLHFANLDVTVPAGAGAFGGSDTSTRFGFHVGAEAAFNLSPTMLFGVEARRTFLDGRFDGVDVGLDGLRLAATLGYHF